jgi:hypothetical protein
LLEGLDRLRDDPTQQDSYAQLEDARIGQVLMSFPVDQRRLVLKFAAEERWQAQRSEQRLALSLALLGGEKPPRGAFYFGDTLRQDAGQHYFGVRFGAEVPRLGSGGFDQLVRHALGFGVHLFPIQAESMAAAHRHMLGDDRSVLSLGLQTGGEGFLRDIPAAEIAARVHRRFGCMYVLSFGPKGLPTDESLGVTVRIARAGAKATAQTKTVIPSASTRGTARVLSAFARGAIPDPGAGFSVSVIFLSVEKNRYRALVQVRASSITIGNAAWDLGVCLVSGGTMRSVFSAQTATRAANVPQVLEKEVSLGDGPYEIVAVGQLNGDRILSSLIEGSLPTPGQDAWVSPIAAVQEGTAAFSRDGITRTSGTVVVRDAEPVNNELPVALISVVCRDGRNGDEVVLRTLSGNDSVRFDPIHVLPADRCVQVRDVIPAKVLEPGRFTYGVRLTRGNAELQSGSRQLLVVADPDVSGRVSTASPAIPPRRR